jgi:hypothetical protein
MAKNTSKIERVHCNGCRQRTEHRLLKTVTHYDQTEAEDSWSTTFDMLECCGCKDAMLRRTFVFNAEEPAVRYFPPLISRHSPSWQYNLPQDIAAVLDEVYRSLDADNRSFKQKLEIFATDGFIGTAQVEILDAALDAGSAAAHRGHTPSFEQVNAVMDIVENLLKAVYVLPDMAESLKKTTPARPSKTPVV